MENTYARSSRHRPAAPSTQSSRLLRSRSGSSPALTLPPKNSICSPSNSQRFSTRSRSNAKSRTNNGEEKVVTQNKGQENREGNTNNNSTSNFSKLLQRGSTSPRTSSFGATKGTTRSSVPGSPSAWALSPGRSLPFRGVAPESPAASARVARAKPITTCGGGGSGSGSGSGGGGVGVSGVLKKYFRLHKKVSPIQEEDFHRFRVLHNRLLQWRFANARAQAAMFVTQRLAEDKLFSVWVRILKVRNNILHKKIKVQKLEHEVKLYQILNPQIFLLNEWTKLERRNQESVSRLVRKLSGISNTIPLVHDAKADVESVSEAFITAMGVMEGIHSMVAEVFPQLEKLLFMVTELVITQKQQKDLEKNINSVVALVGEEASIRAHLIQVAKESRS